MKKTWILAAMASLVTACGGGGGGSADEPAPTAKDVVVRGPITGFGSVIVNGTRFDVSGAQFSIDDNPGGQDDLSQGQIVLVSGSVDDQGQYRATSVSYSSEIKGAIQSIDAAASRFVALGQTVIVSDATIFEDVTGLADLIVGNFVEVSGFRNADGSLQATYVDREDSLGELHLRGIVSAHDATLRRFAIGSAVVDYAGAQLKPAALAITDGLFVEVEGRAGGDVLMATKVAQDDDFDDSRSGASAEVEGLILSVGTDGSLLVDNLTVQTSITTVFEHGTAADLVAGARIEAKGSFQADGSLLATKIEFKNGTAASGGQQGELEGLVESLDAGNLRVRVLGTTLVASPSTIYKDDRDHDREFQFADLRVGDWVEIGFVSTAAGFEATRIERDDADSRSEIKGPLASADALTETLVIATTAVNAVDAIYKKDEVTLTPSAFYAAATPGQRVKAKGRYDGSVLIASEVELDTHSDDRAGDDHGSDDSGSDDHGGGSDDDGQSGGDDAGGDDTGIDG